MMVASITSWRHGRTWAVSLALLVLLCSSQFVPSAQLLNTQATAAAASYSWTPELLAEREALRTQPRYKYIKNYDVAGQWAAFNQSGVFIAPFEPAIPSLPQAQVEFQREYTAKSVILYHEILMDLIANRDRFASGTRMMLKWGGKLIQSILEFRRGEMALEEKFVGQPAFFNLIADLITDVESMSGVKKQAEGYNKRTVPIDTFQERVDFLFDYYKRVVNASPVGNYLRWNTALLYLDQPAHPKHRVELKEEAADLLAQARGIGYESLSFVIKRVVNVLRLFGRGQVPDDANAV